MVDLAATDDNQKQAGRLGGLFEGGPARVEPAPIEAEPKKGQRPSRIAGLFDDGADVSTSLAAAATKDPASYIKSIELGRKYDIPSNYVDKNYQKWALKDKIAKNNVSQLMWKSPGLVKALKNPDLAVLAQDDIENLSGIEKIFGRKQQGSLDRLGYAFQRGLNMAQASVAGGMQLAVSGAIETALIVGKPKGYTPEEWKLMKQAAMETSPPAFKIRKLAAENKDIPRDLETERLTAYVNKVHKEEGVVSATGKGLFRMFANPMILASLGVEQIPTLLMTGAAGVPALGKSIAKPLAAKFSSEKGKKYITNSVAMATQQFVTNLSMVYGSEITEGINQGLTVDEALSRAGKKAITEASVNAGFAFIPVIGKSRPTQIGTETFKQGIAGASGAAAAGAVVGEEVSFGELLLEFGGEAVTAPIDLFFVGMDEIDSRQKKKLHNEILKTVGSASEQAIINEVNARAKYSKMRGYSEDHFKQTVQEIASEYDVEDEVFFDRDAVSEIVNEIEKDTPAINEMKRQLALGGDIVIPFSDYVTDIAGTDIGELLRPHVRLSSSSMSQQEMNESPGLMSERLSIIMEAAAKKAAGKDEIGKIYNDTVEKLKATGRLTDSESKTSALLIPLWAKRATERLGISMKKATDLAIHGPKEPDSSENVIEQAKVVDTPSLYSVQQDFKGIELTEDVTLPNGEDVTIKQSAQKVFDQKMKRRNIVESIVRCVNG